ncbi:MAG TPA: CoA ester lyase [Usitatibacteraceae bacterium]|nr:CoA ester lyase [Usitatibacteraceae bacterium]
MRCKLFVPGSRPELFAKAMASDADAISIDLEDAVDESRKDEAREAVAKFLRSLPADTSKTVIVRVNGVGTPHFEADIEAVAGSGLDLVNLPMPEGPDEVRAASAVIARIEKAKGVARPAGMLANIETPKAFRLAAGIAGADPRVVGLQLGFGDLLEPYGIERYDPRVVLHFQLGVKLAAAEAGVFAFDSAMADVKNVEFLKQEAETARRLGYMGKSAIHPSQIAVINAVFRPTEAEIAHSLKVVASAKEAAAKGVGAWTVDGKMIDAPFVVRAEAILRVARKLGLVAESAGTGWE